MEPKFEPKQYTPDEIAKINESRKDYEKRAGREARKGSSLLEILTGSGITKDNVIESNAHYENGVRDRARWSDEMANRYGLGRKAKRQLFIDLLKKSDLEVISDDNKTILKGRINGQNVEVGLRHPMTHEGQYAQQHVDGRFGKINGVEISSEDAGEIFSLYYNLHDDRIGALENMVRKLRLKREKERDFAELNKTQKREERERLEYNKKQEILKAKSAGEVKKVL